MAHLKFDTEQFVWIEYGGSYWKTKVLLIQIEKGLVKYQVEIPGWNKQMIEQDVCFETLQECEKDYEKRLDAYNKRNQ